MKGWRYESTRHSLAARGVKTSRRYEAKTFAETFFDLREERRKKLAGLGTKQQEEAGKLLKERAVMRLSPEKRAQSKLAIVEAQRSRQMINREILESAYPKLSAVEVGKLSSQVIDDAEESAIPDAMKQNAETNMDARERRKVLDKYKYAYGDDYVKLRNKLDAIIERTQPEGSKSWEDE